MRFPAPNAPSTYLGADFPSYDDEFEHDDVWDMLSPVSGVDWLIEEITGWSPVRAISNEFTGDFASLYEKRDRWNAYADALDAHGYGYTAAYRLSTEYGGSWEGSSYGRFYSYMSAWALASRDLAQHARYMADTLGPVADEAKRLSNAIGEGLIALGDLAISPSLKGGLKAAKAVWSAIRGELDDMIREVVELVFDLMNAVEAIVDLGKGLADVFQQWWGGTDFALPEVHVPTGDIWRPDKHQEDL